MTPMSPNGPLVSVVLPTHKRAHLLPYAIANVLEQSHGNLELIVVDDCSPDHTAEVVARFDDPRLRYHRNASNLKLPGSLNQGFALARGQCLTWTSDDNLYAPTAIERMVARLAGGDCDFVYADYHLFGVSDERTGQPLDAQPNPLPDRLCLAARNQVGACFMYTREVYETIGDYDTELFLVEDYDYFIRIAARFRISHIAEPLYYFRRDEDTLFCSRFATVKAADVLVRYKNGLIDREAAVKDLAELIVQNAERLSNPLLRHGHRLARRLSWRLGRGAERLLRASLDRALRREVPPVLEQFDARALSFTEGRDALCRLVTRHAAVAYR